jgi:hypothetical protein
MYQGKPKERKETRPESKVEFIKRNRSARLEGKPGYYDGQAITSNYIWIDDDTDEKPRD